MTVNRFRQMFKQLQSRGHGGIGRSFSITDEL